MAVATETVGDPAHVLSVRGITKLYGGLRAVDALSFSVERGEIFGIAGPNGAGKTTLFDALTGHVTASSGAIDLAGASIRGTKIHHRVRLGLARTFQHPVAADTLTVLENAYLAASFQRGRPRFRARASDIAAGRAALDVVGLGDCADTPAGALRVYDKKLLMMATAIATDPLVLLLDEPFGGLSPLEIETTIGIIRRIRDSGVAVVCIEHVMRALVALSDRVLVMHHGSELFLGTPQEMVKDPAVVSVYLGSGRGAGA